MRILLNACLSGILAFSSLTSLKAATSPSSSFSFDYGHKEGKVSLSPVSSVHTIVEGINRQRDALAKDLQPSMVLLPLTNQASQWVGHRGINFQLKRAPLLKERQLVAQTIARSCILHPHKTFFEHAYFLESKAAPQREYIAHLTALFINDVGVRILESLSILDAALKLGSRGLFQHVQRFCQRLVENKDVALSPLTNDGALRVGILSELARYSAERYEKILTSNFIDWYKEIYNLHPGRKWAGIEQVNAVYVAPPAAPVQILNVVFRNGQCVKIDYRTKGFSFKGPITITSPFQKTPDYLSYNGATINFNVPIAQMVQTLQQSRTIQHASIELQKVPLGEECARISNPLTEKVNGFPKDEFLSFLPFQKDDQINTLRTAVGVSCIFSTLGFLPAAENWTVQKLLLGKSLWDKASPKLQETPLTTFYKEIALLCNEILELFPLEGAGVILNNYGDYLNAFAVTLFQAGSLSRQEAVAHLKKAELLLQSALLQGYNEIATSNLKNIRTNLHTLIQPNLYLIFAAR